MWTRLLVKALFLFNCKLLCYFSPFAKISLVFLWKSNFKGGELHKKQKPEYIFESEKRIRKMMMFLSPRRPIF